MGFQKETSKLRPEDEWELDTIKRGRREFSAAGKATEGRTCVAGKLRQFETWNTEYKVRAGERRGWGLIFTGRSQGLGIRCPKQLGAHSTVGFLSCWNGHRGNRGPDLLVPLYEFKSLLLPSIYATS